MLTYYKLYWKKAFKISGRSTRKEFWYPIVLTFLLYGVIKLILPEIFLLQINKYLVINLFLLINIIPIFTLTIRRFHDVGLTMIIPTVFFVPEFIYIIISFIPTQVIEQLISGFSIEIIRISDFAWLLCFLIALCLFIFVFLICCSKGYNNINKNNTNN